MTEDDDRVAHTRSLRGFDGVLMPGGGDINPRRYGMPDTHEALYDMDDLQDESDLTLAAHALENSIPLLAICRGVQVLNVAAGGSLVIAATGTEVEIEPMMFHPALTGTDASESGAPVICTTSADGSLSQYPVPAASDSFA